MSKTAISPKQKVSVGMLSLGCPKTLVDSELVLGQLDPKRYRMANHVTDCDIAFLNTCAFIEDSKRESIDRILELIELKKEGHIKALVVLGCLVQRYPDELSKQLKEVDVFLGTGEYAKIQEVTNGLSEQLGLCHPFVTEYSGPQNGLKDGQMKLNHGMELHSQLRESRTI